jgi:hypothetical protein
MEAIVEIEITEEVIETGDTNPGTERTVGNSKEEISVTDPRDVSTAKKKATSPKIVQNVHFI